ncbi:MAG: Crp/Fnr family transcriptional regulator [Proteobacteria bacterium]|nr:Crp/Fnr family transcriptional regulator [Pseudomonadota bacterium]
MPYTTYSLDKLPLLAGLKDEEKKALISSGIERHYPKGSYLFHCGEPVTHFYVVCSGAMQLVRGTTDGKEVTQDIVIQGKTIGKTEILQQVHKIHMVSALAVEDSVVLEFPAAWLKSIAQNPTVALNILSSLSQYIHMMELEVEHKSTMDTAQQLGCFLQRLCVLHNFDPKGFTLPYSKSLIASRLGIEPETFSRTLKKLKSYGIGIKGNTISFADSALIEQSVCSHCSSLETCSTHKAVVTGLLHKKSS